MTSSAALRRVSASGRGVAVLFVANALVFASIVTRYPELKEQFGLSDVSFGLMVACGPVGSVLGSATAGRLLRRSGAVPMAVTSSVVLGVMLVVAAFVGTPVLFGVVLFAIGVADATGDVANNAHGLEVQRRLGRSIINGLHGAWSTGAIAGGLIGLVALQLGVPISIHLLALGILVIAASIGAARWLPLPLPLPPDARAAPPSTRSSRAFHPMLIAACALAVIGAFLEDLGSTWGGVYLVQETDAALTSAALPFVAMMGTLTVGRFASDRLVDRLSPVGTVRLGSALAVVGVLAVAIGPSGWLVVAGFAILGLGIAPMIPLAMDAAERAPGIAPGTGLATVATIMRLGFLASPLLVGLLAETADLRVAVTICLAVPALSFLLAGALRAR